MDYRKLVEASLEYADKIGIDQAEVYVNKTRLMRISSQKSQINDLKYSNSHGMTMRIVKDGHCSRVYTESLTLPDIQNMLDQAVEYAKFAPIREEFVFSQPQTEAQNDFRTIGSSLQEVEIERKKEQALHLERAFHDKSSEQVDVTHAFYGDFQNEVYIGNSLGVMAGYSEERCELLVGMKAQRDQSVSLYAATQMERDFHNLSPERLVDDVLFRTQRLLGATKPEKGTYPVIFGPKAMCDFLRVFSPIFFADSQNLSKLYGKLNEQVASPLLTIKDDPLLPQAGMRFVDDEGYPCRPRTVLDQGRMENYLFNNAAAKRHGVQDGGSAFRRSFKTRVITAASNMYVENGHSNPDDMISDLGSGLYIEELQGLEGTFHWEYPSFNIRARGFLVEHGEITAPIHEFVIQGTIEDFLKDIVQIGNDFTWGPATNRQCFGSPSVLIQKIGVSA